MTIYLVGSNTVVATLECANGHSWSIGDARRFLRLKETQRPIMCPEKDTQQCKEWIAVWRLQEYLKEMLERGEKERNLENYVEPQKPNIQEELIP